jgi:predicted TIM-barrel fold metal-dependent hydrolase
MPLRGWVTLLKDVIAQRPQEEQRKLFHDNAVKFYALA